MENGPFEFSLLYIIGALCFMFLVIAAVTNVLYGLGVNHPSVTPFWRVSRGVHLALGVIALGVCLWIVDVVAGIPVFEVIEKTIERFL